MRTSESFMGGCSSMHLAGRSTRSRKIPDTVPNGQEFGNGWHVVDGPPIPLSDRAWWGYPSVGFSTSVGASISANGYTV